jgi:hypothetical protein
VIYNTFSIFLLFECQRKMNNDNRNKKVYRRCVDALLYLCSLEIFSRNIKKILALTSWPYANWTNYSQLDHGFTGPVVELSTPDCQSTHNTLYKTSNNGFTPGCYNNSGKLSINRKANILYNYIYWNKFISDI